MNMILKKMNLPCLISGKDKLYGIYEEDFEVEGASDLSLQPTLALRLCPKSKFALPVAVLFALKAVAVAAALVTVDVDDPEEELPANSFLSTIGFRSC